MIFKKLQGAYQAPKMHPRVWGANKSNTRIHLGGISLSLTHRLFIKLCVRRIHLTSCFSVVSRLHGGNVLMSYLPAWMMISKSQSSCCAKNNEESQGEGDQEQSEICWKTPETFPRPVWRRGRGGSEENWTKLLMHSVCLPEWSSVGLLGKKHSVSHDCTTLDQKDVL